MTRSKADHRPPFYVAAQAWPWRCATATDGSAWALDGLNRKRSRWVTVAVGSDFHSLEAIWRRLTGRPLETQVRP